MEQRGAVTDDPGRLLAAPGHEPGGVDQYDERQPEAIALRDEEGRLLGRGRVDHAAEVMRLVGDHPHRAPLDAGERGDHVSRPAVADLDRRVAVDDPCRDLPHVVDAPRLVRHDRGRIPAERRVSVGGRWRGADRLRQKRQELAGTLHRLGVRGGDQVADAVSLVKVGPAELLHRHLLAEGLTHHAGAGEEHARLTGHEHEVGEGRRVRAPARRDARHDRDLGHPPGQLDARAEDPPVAAERCVALLDPGAARLDESHHGGPPAPSQLEHPHDRVRVRFAQRPSHEARVLRVAEDRAPVDPPGSHGDAVARPCLLPEAGGHDAGADRFERSEIAKQLEPLARARGERLGLQGDQGHGTARQRTALWPPKPKASESAMSGRGPSPFGRRSSCRDSFGT